MKAFLSTGWSLITFRAGPDALPYAPRMILPLVVLNLALGFVIQAVAGSGMDKPVVQLSAMALAAEALWLWLLLRRRGWDNRWVQGFSALVLIDTDAGVAKPVWLTFTNSKPVTAIAASLSWKLRMLRSCCSGNSTCH